MAVSEQPRGPKLTSWLGEKLFQNYVWRSIFRSGYPNTPRNQMLVVATNVFLHLHPTRLHKTHVKITHTYCLGGITFFFFLGLTVTGVMLMFYYVPAPDRAFADIQALETNVRFGSLMRNLHRWMAHGMVISVFLHMMRVFYTGAYKPPREFNWVVGVILLTLTLALSFTGYLLPWDQLAFWAITVGSNIAGYAPALGDQLKYLLLGGNVIGEGTVLRFYVLHCVILPSAAILLVAVHVYRIRKDGLSAPTEPAPPVTEELTPGRFPASTKSYGLMALTDRPSQAVVESDPDDDVMSWPHLLYRELLVALAVLVALHVVSLLFNAPLEEIADPTRTPNPAKAPWYFLGLQELVHYSAFVGGVLVPTLLVLVLVALPYVDATPRGIGVWFARERRWANLIFAVLAVLAVLLTLIGTFFRGPNWGWVWPWVS